ncbi:Benzoate 1,2-dioxygenase electron transfer component [Novipirellula galeiformis]|uniref:Benzoate 1,2-dioxygenase electron transfer component n=1 Tax=Novipirellula galeiformis TaxID=2528004 RepID=A0A5C6CC61_9BACT|nr:flavodoxin reductase [Novipirellula galeiformis]TWU21615.1 Benzoate 1,2-dioxygenase electron transfer component [Novipirellula galeiformis]
MNGKSHVSSPQSETENWRDFGEHRGRILHREPLAKNVHCYVVEKPNGFVFRPGQAVELSIDEENWRDKKHPFTITSVPNNPCLEFIIKSYPTSDFPDHCGMTEHLGRDLQRGDRVIFSDAWGAIEYKGPGVFIAGGAGITPFIAILRQLEQDKAIDGNCMFFSNRNAEDVFLQSELIRTFGTRVICTLTGEAHRDYESGRIDKAWLQAHVDDFHQPFYLCGPPAMVQDIRETLQQLGAKPDSLVFEEGE